MKPDSNNIETRYSASLQSNHNIWHICQSCGLEFDRHLVLNEHCPICNTPVNSE